mgnify:CR=1 FL=1
MAVTPPLRVAIVGAGPAGFFLADKLLGQSGIPVAVDLFERLPVPYGLVRFGVAPDHEKIKNVTRSFDKVAAKPGFRYFGNVEVGRHVSIDELRRHHHAIAFTTGAQSDRRMGIPGEDLIGSHAATEFVAWYNGHPDFCDARFDLGVERVAVVGIGNVAIDVARILSRSPEELATTDIADHALEALAQSRIREVVLLGRRGPAQAAFTTPEVKELGELVHADALARGDEVALDPLSARMLTDDANERRKLEILTDYAGRQPTGKPKRLLLRFLVSPTELIGDEQGRVKAIRITRNRLVEKDGALIAEPTGEIEEIPVGLVFRSVGYRGVPIPGLPFDERRAIVPNAGGRVLDPATGATVPGLYVAGWIKRGPSGVIGTNKPDAGETADAILADAAGEVLADPPEPSPDGIAALLESRQPELVTWTHWQKIAEHEVARGKPVGRPRSKLTRVADMLKAALGK